MLYQPVIGLGGYAGWLVLQRTEVRQREIFEESATIQRDTDYFRENIQNALTAEDLVSDRRLLSVALGAFSLDEEINKQAFVQKILEDGTETSTAFARRLGEPRFLAFAQAFGYGNADGGAKVLLDSFREDIIARYKVQTFDRAVGEVDGDARLALNFRREIPDLMTEDVAEETNWYRIMGQQPLREVIATALNIPSEASQLDIEQQQEIFAERASRVFGDSNPTIFKSPEVLDDALRRFFLVRQAQSGPSALTTGVAALTLLQSSPLGAGASQGLFQSLV